MPEPTSAAAPAAPEIDPESAAERDPDPAAERTRSWRAARLAGARLYLCTDAAALHTGGMAALEAFFEAAYRGGVDIIQLRDKSLEARDEIAALEVLAEVARRHGRLYAVNDRADVALLVGADVFHVGQGDLTTAQARRVLGPDVLLGRSTRDLEQVRAAIEDPGVDYYCTGPVWQTPTKPGRAAVGTQLPESAYRLMADAHRDHGIEPKPFFAIGGIDADRLPQVLATGATRIVVVRAITEAADPQAAARALSAALRAGEALEAPADRPSGRTG